MHYLPTIAAMAWYQDAVADKPALLNPYFAEVERFAYAAYAPALLKGHAFPVEKKFLQVLLRGRGQFAGRIDSRFSSPSLNPLNGVMD